MIETDIALYHVGCGHYLFNLSQASGMALACSCGANSPIVVSDLESGIAESVVLPGSLLSINKGQKDKPHLEYYLGFSDFTCPAKQAWEKRLREEFGLISFSECSRAECQRESERSKSRYNPCSCKNLR